MISIKKLVPSWLKRRVMESVLTAMRNRRIHTEESITKVHLTQKHIKNCELILNRSILLSKLKRNAVVAEIGVANGDFSEQILAKTQPEKLHLIDIWGNQQYNEGMYKSVRNKFNEQIKNEKVAIHRKPSIEAADEFPDHYFDWIYLDTSHRYQLTKEELRKYSKKVKLNGIIAGHDYTIGNWIDSVRYGVIEATHEFCVNYDWELIYLTLDPIETESFAIRRIAGSPTN